MVRQARRAATLVPGASLRRLLFDTCADNCIPNTFGMLQHFGISLDTSGYITGLASGLSILQKFSPLRRFFALIGRDPTPHFCWDCLYMAWRS